MDPTRSSSRGCRKGESIFRAFRGERGRNIDPVSRGDTPGTPSSRPRSHPERFQCSREAKYTSYRSLFPRTTLQYAGVTLICPASAAALSSSSEHFVAARRPSLSKLPRVSLRLASRCRRYRGTLDLLDSSIMSQASAGKARDQSAAAFFIEGDHQRASSSASCSELRSYGPRDAGEALFW